MKLFMMAWEWVVGVVRFFSRGSLWLALSGVLIIAGCSAGGGFVGSPHGMSGTINTIWADVNGVPTIVPDDARPMGFRDGDQEDIYTTYSDGFGTIATGRAAYVLALARLCATAPNIGLCSGAEQIVQQERAFALAAARQRRTAAELAWAIPEGFSVQAPVE